MTINIVLTGGPCGGKTTCLSILRTELSERGYRVHVLPEVATLLFTSGHSHHDSDIQEKILRTMYHLHSLIGSDVDIVIWDRGVYDVASYSSAEEWSYLLEKLPFIPTLVPDAVFHLKTSALCGFYTTANNTARRESVDEAISADLRTLTSWTGHPHLSIINNQSTFAAKVDCLIEQVLWFLGEPYKIERERKFLVSPAFSPQRLSDHGISYKSSFIEQHYLSNGWRVRKQEFDKSYIFTQTKKTTSVDGTLEEESIITEHAFLSACRYSTSSITKIRHYFIYGDIYYELDEFDDCMVLECEHKHTDKILPPEFIPIVKEVTLDSNYSNRAMSERKLLERSMD